MPIIFRYFWLLTAVVMLINVLIWQRRLVALVERGVVTKTEASGFVRGATIWLVGGSLIAGFISVWAGWPSPFCAGMLSFADVPKMLISVLVIVSWVSLLWWVWGGNGANFLSRALPALARRPPRITPSPGVVRAVVTLTVAVSAIATPIAWRQMSIDPMLACNAPGGVALPAPR